MKSWILSCGQHRRTTHWFENEGCGGRGSAVGGASDLLILVADNAGVESRERTLLRLIISVVYEEMDD